ncbi:hypothetical protein [Kribbella deserti]|uniref:tRNA-dihydrouridine synthase n=1 Tax=Kribbella deserti TaxID=1926257 RepID=A0ABV6QQX6_9ACTN
MSQSRRRMRSAGITLGLTALVAASLTGCSNDEPKDYAAICVNPQTEERVDDDQCDDEREYNGSGGGGGGFFWFYMATRGGGLVPPVGGRYSPSAGTYSVSTLRNSKGRPVSVQRGGLDTRGGDIGTIARGGFGKSSKGGSGG